MAYEDVPERLLNGEWVPRSEIIGYGEPYTQPQIVYCLACMVMIMVLETRYSSGFEEFRITEFGQMLRQDFVIRIEGDCPETP